MSNWKIIINGVEKDLADDYYFRVAYSTGTGMVAHNNIATPLPLQGGSLHSKTTFADRVFALHGTFNTENDASESNFHSRKQALLKILNVNAGLKINERPSPINLRYTGASVNKDIFCFYESGLGDNHKGGFAHDPISIVFVAYDPNFYATSESNTVLNTSDSATFNYIAAKIDGEWDNLGAPTGGATISAIVADDDYVYVGGQFTNLNSIANADYIARYNKSTGVWSALGTGLNGECTELAISLDGTLYAVGDITNAGGTSVNYIASWDGSNWSALGTGTNFEPAALAVGPDGTVYVAGGFTTAGGVSVNNIAAWDGSSWSALGSGLGSTTVALAIGPDGTLYAGGAFTMAGGNPANYVAAWDGSSWSALGSGLGNGCTSLVVSSNGTLYAGGVFSTAGGGSAERVAAWNGSSWSGLGTGLNNLVYSLAISPDGLLYVGGNFTSAGNNPITDKIAIWNGSSWVHTDINLPGSPSVFKVLFDGEDLYLGFNTAGTATYSQSTDIAYGGSQKAFLRIECSRSGGTNATLKYIENLTTGAKIWLQHNLLDGETVTIEGDPYIGISVTSDLLGNKNNTIFPNSNLGQLFLTPNNDAGNKTNTLVAYVEESGSPTIMMTAYYTVTYISQD
jgi:hypothetical protein